MQSKNAKEVQPETSTVPKDETSQAQRTVRTEIKQVLKDERGQAVLSDTVAEVAPNGVTAKTMEEKRLPAHLRALPLCPDHRQEYFVLIGDVERKEKKHSEDVRR